ncbi:GPR1/FUN34/yaaH family-domain-containing protein [Sphaerosporella brunnea]|uniref:GPR1/FUN34/yaaH family-domain-containing protein n=1 Tax=Sphaerosporella brunnea TaxID=1250544 RepID=A0A5J5ESJ5_9PEZI|nr:GPR1/FUN34/yaaH family-domain-containing protein [Sphaerosporella brunnea]
MSTSNSSVVQDIEKDAGSTPTHDYVERVQTITLTPEVFEKLYLTPQNKVKGDLHSAFGNPTPVALIGLILSLTPLSIVLLGWKGASVSAFDAVFVFAGGVLMIVAGVLEFFLGTTFPCVVFISQGSLYFVLGAMNIPGFGVMQAFVTSEYTSGDQNPQFYNSFAFFLACIGFECFVFMLAALRINLLLFLIFLFTVLGVELLAGGYWAIGYGNMELGTKLVHVAGGSLLVVALLGWYYFYVTVPWASSGLFPTPRYSLQIVTPWMARLMRG